MKAAKLDVSPWNLGLPLVVLAACGRTLPLDPVGETEGETHGETETSDTLDPTEQPPLECEGDQDCDPGYYCSADNQCVEYYDYCSDGGCCWDGCCYDGCYYYDCYSDSDCGDGYECSEYLECVPVEPGPSVCELPVPLYDPLVIGEHSPGAVSLAFFDGDPQPGHELLVGDALGVTLRRADGETLPLLGTGVVDLAVGDVDGDGDQDVVVLDGTTLTVALTGGDGSFSLGPASVLDGVVAQRLELAQFDAGGALDVFVLASGMVVRMAGQGDGSFAAPELLYEGVDEFAVMPSPGGAFDDLVLASSGTALYVPGNEGGVLSPQGLGAPTRWGADVLVTAGEFDGDGVADAVVLNRQGSTAAIWHDVAALPAAVVWTPPVPQLLAATGDLDGDGRDDLWLAGGAEVTVRFGAPALYVPEFGAYDPLGCYVGAALPYVPVAIAVGDHDGSGTADLVASDGQSLWLSLGAP